jgi:hypothetical protein
MSKILFVGQERSKLAQERGVYWDQHIFEKIGDLV